MSAVHGATRRTTRVWTTAALLALALVVALITPGQAEAATSNNLLQRRDFSNTPSKSFSTCLHRDVTLPKLSSTQRWAWSENFPQERSAYAINYSQTFHGTFYWTVCVVSLYGNAHSGDTYAYYMYSLLTGETSACEEQGRCTTYHLSNHYLPTGGRNIVWGSQLFAVPSDECTTGQDGLPSCEETAVVTVTTS